MKKTMLGVILISIFNFFQTVHAQTVSPTIKTLGVQTDAATKMVAEIMQRTQLRGDTEVHITLSPCEISEKEISIVSAQLRKATDIQGQQVDAIGSLIDFLYVKDQYYHFCFCYYSDGDHNMCVKRDAGTFVTMDVPQWVKRLNQEMCDDKTRTEQNFQHSAYYQNACDRFAKKLKLVIMQNPEEQGQERSYENYLTTEKPLASYDPDEIIFLTNIFAGMFDSDFIWKRNDVIVAAQKLLDHSDMFCKEKGRILMENAKDFPETI